MKIVTAGARYLDIDAYAGIIAFAELLQAQGQEAQAVSTAVLNESITPSIRTWPVELATTYTPSDKDTFILIDVSDLAHFDPIVDAARVERVIDHHPGLAEYWREHIGDGAEIEFIGAACTQVYEAWKRAGLLEKMSDTSAKLLAAGILDNTLNFKATVTTQRDHDAYAAMAAHANLSDKWADEYFSECQQSILAALPVAIHNDSKLLRFDDFPRELAVGQLVVWDAQELLAKHRAIIQGTLAPMKPDWFMNVVSIDEGRSYFLAESPEVQAWLERLLGVKFEGAIATAKRLWLRKEIIKESLDSK